MQLMKNVYEMVLGWNRFVFGCSDEDVDDDVDNHVDDDDETMLMMMLITMLMMMMKCTFSWQLSPTQDCNVCTSAKTFISSQCSPSIRLSQTFLIIVIMLARNFSERVAKETVKGEFNYFNFNWSTKQALCNIS